MKKTITVSLSILVLLCVFCVLLAADYVRPTVLSGFTDIIFGRSDDTDSTDSYPLSIGKKSINTGTLPDLDISDWKLTLVNFENPLPNDQNVNCGTTAEGYLFDSRAVDALDAFIAAGRAEGLQLVLTSAYRSYDYQNELFQDKIGRVMDEYGCSYEKAELIAAREVARPGMSEHNLGLAADIVCEYYGIMDSGYADTPEAKWLREHCAEYGFILRYEEGKENLTQIIYEPWHFRYVGVEAATYIMENDLCLEEFLALYE